MVQHAWSELGPGVEVTPHANEGGGTDQDHVVELTSPTARDLADLAGIVLDLAFVHEAVLRLKATSKPPEDIIVAQALWNAALVAYARCFTTGKRLGLKSSLFDGLDPGAAEAHQYVMNMRGKHVAHAVNPFDQVRVGVVLSPPGSANRNVRGTVQFRQHLVGWDQGGLETLQHLTDAAHAFAMRRYNEVEAALYDEALALSIEDLYRRPAMRIITPGSGDARQPRR